MPRKNLLTTLIILFLISISGIIVSGIVKADEFSDKYQEYLNKSSTYRSDYTAYIIARSQYLSFNTLNSKNQAVNATKTFITSRNNVLISYIGLLKTVNAEDFLSTYWSEQEKFINDVNGRVTTIGSLDDCLTISEMVENKHFEYQLYAKKTSGLNIISNVEKQLQKYNELIDKSNQFVSEIKNKQKDVTLLERWLLDAKNKQWLVDQKINTAKTNLTNINSRDVDALNNDFNAILYTIFEAHQNLKEGLKYLNEFSENIKYGNY